MEGSYLGPEFSYMEIERAAKKYKAVLQNMMTSENWQKRPLN